MRFRPLAFLPFLACLAIVLSVLTVLPAAAQDNPRVVLETSKGKIVVELFKDEAPKSTANFLAYVDAGFYDGTLFHRVIPDFMIQGGGFDAEMKKKPPRAPIENEADNGLKNERGTLAMARTSDPHSATAQFFVNTADNQFLDHTAKNPRGWGYAVFGKVVKGMEVVDAISAVETGRHGRMGDVPVEKVVIVKASRHDASSGEAEGAGTGDAGAGENAEGEGR